MEDSNLRVAVPKTAALPTWLIPNKPYKNTLDHLCYMTKAKVGEPILHLSDTTPITLIKSRQLPLIGLYWSIQLIIVDDILLI